MHYISVSWSHFRSMYLRCNLGTLFFIKLQVFPHLTFPFAVFNLYCNISFPFKKLSPTLFSPSSASLQRAGKDGRICRINSESESKYLIQPNIQANIEDVLPFNYCRLLQNIRCLCDISREMTNHMPLKANRELLEK